MELVYNLIRSKRKTIALSIGEDLSVQVKAPTRMPRRDIDSFVAKHEGWISRQRQVVEHRNNNILSQEQVAVLYQRARDILPQRVHYYGIVMGLEPTGVKITGAQSRWGSCSGRNSICFSYRMMLLPPNVIDYIVVHELAHIRVRNHSSNFYREIATYMPDYKERIAVLKRMEKELPRSP